MKLNKGIKHSSQLLGARLDWMPLFIVLLHTNSKGVVGTLTRRLQDWCSLWLSKCNALIRR